MAFIFPSEGQVELLTNLANSFTAYNLRFFTNNITPAYATSYNTASFTSATSMSGGQTFGAVWATPVSVNNTSAAVSITANVVQTYVPAGASSQTLFGFYVYDSSNKVVWADNVAAITVVNNGDLVQMTSQVITLIGN